ncbi:MAG: glucose-1-phosphate adenylyltransferase [Magnetospiraceae bacterium]
MVSLVTPTTDVNAALRRTLALVLAGGRGTRLRCLTESQSKPAVPIGGKFRIIDFPLSNCLNSGLRRIAVLTQYEAHTLIQHVQRGWGFLRAELGEFIEVWPAQQRTANDSWYLGTADAVYQNLSFIQHADPEYVLILAGDHIYKQDYSWMLHEHVKRGADVTVACVEVPKEEAKGFGVVKVDDQDMITGFVEKPADPPTIPGNKNVSFASMGIYIFNMEFLNTHLERDALVEESSRDFGKDLLPFLVGKCRLYAHRFKDSCVATKKGSEPYWRDVGTIDAYWEANMDLTRVTPALDLYDDHWPIWTYQEQRPSAKFVFDNDERRGVAVDSLVSAGCVVSGGTVRRSLLFNNVRVNSYTLVEDSVILPNVDIGRNTRLRKCIIDQDCKVPEGLVIGEDPVLDARRFERTEKGITLVSQAMLARL